MRARFSVPYLPARGREPVAGPPVGRDLGAQVPAALGRSAHVREDDVLHVAVDHTGPLDAHRRQAEPFAVDLGHRAVAAGGGAADVGPVRAHAAEAEQGFAAFAAAAAVVAAADEGGSDHVHVRQVRAAEVGVVVDERVARPDVFSPGLGHRAHRIRHRAEVDGEIGALRHHVSAGVEHAAGIVPGDLEDGRVGGLREHHLHLLRDRVEAVLHDLEGGGVGARRGGGDLLGVG